MAANPTYLAIASMPRSNTGPKVDTKLKPVSWCQVWMRHGDKAHVNGKHITGYSHDPELTRVGQAQIRQQTIHLLGKFAPPEQIRCSPFLRCRQSAEIMQATIMEITGIEVKITADRWIGEYLGNHPHLQLSGAVSPDTLAYKPVVHENLKSFKKRRMSGIIKHNPYINCWYITHGIIVDHLIQHFTSSSHTTSSNPDPSSSNSVSYPGQYGKTQTGGGFTLHQSQDGNGEVTSSSLTVLPKFTLSELGLEPF